MKPESDITPNKRTDPTDRLLTIEQVAEECQCSQLQVRKWISNGEISYVVLGGGEKKDGITRIKESALIKFWNKKERKAIP